MVNSRKVQKWLKDYKSKLCMRECGQEVGFNDKQIITRDSMTKAKQI